MEQRNCVSCGQRVKRSDDYLKAHRWASTGFFHWSCFLALMTSHDKSLVANTGEKRVEAGELGK